MTVKELKNVFELINNDALVIVDSEGRSKADCVQMAEYFEEKTLVISGF